MRRVIAGLALLLLSSTSVLAQEDLTPQEKQRLERQQHASIYSTERRENEVKPTPSQHVARTAKYPRTTCPKIRSPASTAGSRTPRCLIWRAACWAMRRLLGRGFWRVLGAC